MTAQQQVETFLQEHKIAYKIKTHPAVFTCEEAEQHCKTVPGIAEKNFFLKDKTKNYFLYILPAKKRADLKVFAAQIQTKKVTFASDSELKEKLGLEPGSVSIFGLLNDTKKEVALYLDQEIYDAATVNFHPNVNTASVIVEHKEFKKILDAFGYQVQLLKN